jgi:hypothetical protein
MRLFWPVGSFAESNKEYILTFNILAQILVDYSFLNEHRAQRKICPGARGYEVDARGCAGLTRCTWCTGTMEGGPKGGPHVVRVRDVGQVFGWLGGLDGGVADCGFQYLMEALDLYIVLL